MSAIENIEAAARAGGVPLAAANVSAAGKEYLTFRLGTEEYGIDILKVQEIRGYEVSTKIANTPDFIKGVVNLRGVIVPIVDLRVKFGLAGAAYDVSTVTIILNVLGRVVGAVVDSVSDVLELKAEQIKPAPAFNGTIDTGFITGIGSVQQGEQDRMLVLIDIEQLMGTADMCLVKS
jgi:purine-binding chemotaxis protein CheW